MAKRSHWDEMKARRAAKEQAERDAARISTLEPPDPSRIAMTADWILVRKTPKDRTEGGIVLPEGSQAADGGDATVVAVGPGWWCQGTFIPMTLKVGDEVLIGPQAEMFAMPADRTLFALRETGVMAVLKPKPAPEPAA